MEYQEGHKRGDAPFQILVVNASLCKQNLYPLHKVCTLFASENDFCE